MPGTLRVWRVEKGKGAWTRALVRLFPLWLSAQQPGVLCEPRGWGLTAFLGSFLHPDRLWAGAGCGLWLQLASPCFRQSCLMTRRRPAFAIHLKSFLLFCQLEGELECEGGIKC